MKKRIFSLLLVLAMLVTVSVFAVEATEPQGTAFDEASAVDGVVTAYCEACKQDVQWTKATLADGAIVVSDHIYVSNSYTAEAPMVATALTRIESTVCLYLNGTLTNAENHIFRLGTDVETPKTDCVLNIMGTGSIVATATAKNIVYTQKNASGGIDKLAIYGGTLDCSNVTGISGAICRVDEEKYGAITEVEVHGGTIIGGKISFKSSACYGGAFNLSGAAKFTMSDGTIRDGSVEVREKTTGTARGGNVRMGAGSTFILTGGIIQGGKAYANTGVIVGGGNVYMDAGSTFTMTGGQIVDGEIYVKSTSGKAYGGNVYIAGSSSKTGYADISGGEISGGVTYSASKTAHGGNLYLGTGVNAEISSEDGDTLISGGRAQGRNDACATSSKSDYWYGGKGGNIFVGTGVLKISGGRIEDGICAESKADGVSNTSYTDQGCRGGNLYVAGSADVEITGGTFINKCSTTGYSQAWAGGNIALGESDCVVTIGGEALLIGGKASRGGNICVLEGQLNIEGGIIRGGYATSGGAIHSEASVLMTNGIITSALPEDGLTYTGGANSNGGCVYTAAEFTMDGTNAVINGVKSQYGSAVAVGEGSYKSTRKGTFILKNGTVNGGTATKEGGAIRVLVDGKLIISGGTVNPGTASVKGDAVVVDEGGLMTVSDGFIGKLLFALNGTDVSDGVVSAVAVADGVYANQGTLILEGETEEIPVYADGTVLKVAQSAIFDGKNIVSVPATAQAAVETDLAAGQYVKLFGAVQETLNVTKDTYLDINGKAVTLNIADGVKLYGMDTATNDYDDTDAGVVTLADGSAAPQFNTVIDLTIDGQQGQRKYVYLQNGFHRYYVAQRNIGIRVNKDDAAPDLIFSGTFRGTQTLADNVESFGINFQDVEGNSNMIDYVSCGQTFTPTNPIYGRNINITITEAQAEEWGEKMFRGIPYIKITGSDELLTPTNISAPTSAKEQVAYFCNNYATLTESQQTLVDAMIEKSKALFDECGWNYSKAV